MLGDFRCPFVEIAAGFLQRPGHRGVHPRLPGAQLRALRHLLRQRVLERIFRPRPDRSLIQKFRRHQCRQRLIQRRLIQRRDARQHLTQQRFGKLLADHRGGLQHLLFAFAQTIDARGEHGLHAGRNVQCRDRRGQPVGAAHPRPDGRFRSAIAALPR